MRFSQALPNMTTPHYTRVKQGALHSSAEGAHLLLHTTDCLSLNQTECAPAGTPLYYWTHQVLL
jgi:hypothetical protein